MLNCLLIRPLWHDRNGCICTHTRARRSTHIDTHFRAHQIHTNTRIHTSIYTSNLLVMRSVLSLELRERREDVEERRKRDERRGGQQRKSHVMFSQWRSGSVSNQSSQLQQDTFQVVKSTAYYALMCMCLNQFMYGNNKSMSLCVLADRVQYRCDEEVFSPEELPVHCPGHTVRVEPR